MIKILEVNSFKLHVLWMTEIENILDGSVHLKENILPDMLLAENAKTSDQCCRVAFLEITPGMGWLSYVESQETSIYNICV